MYSAVIWVRSDKFCSLLSFEFDVSSFVFCCYLSLKCQVLFFVVIWIWRVKFCTLLSFEFGVSSFVFCCHLKLMSQFCSLLSFEFEVSSFVLWCHLRLTCQVLWVKIVSIQCHAVTDHLVKWESLSKLSNNFIIFFSLFAIPLHFLDEFIVWQK